LRPEFNRKFNAKLLLSIHVPKTGGTALREVLLARFGNNLHLDYGYDTNIENTETDIRAIHTHNPYVAYKDLQEKPKVLTILREPLDRAISHYYYWLNLPSTEDPEPHGEIYRKYFLDQKPDLEKFLLSDDHWMQNIYTQHFLYPLSKPEDFWFIGFLETFDEDIADLQRLLGLKRTKPPVENKGQKPSIKISDALKRDFYELNKKDKVFYDAMFAERNKRKKKIIGVEAIRNIIRKTYHILRT
jgi:Sulfotransferase family